MMKWGRDTYIISLKEKTSREERKVNGVIIHLNVSQKIVEKRGQLQSSITTLGTLQHLGTMCVRKFVIRNFVIRNFVIGNFVIRTFVIRNFVIRSFVPAPQRDKRGVVPTDWLSKWGLME
jgi:hypothetical protein